MKMEYKLFFVIAILLAVLTGIVIGREVNESRVFAQPAASGGGNFQIGTITPLEGSIEMLYLFNEREETLAIYRLEKFKEDNSTGDVVLVGARKVEWDTQIQDTRPRGEGLRPKQVKKALEKALGENLEEGDDQMPPPVEDE